MAPGYVFIDLKLPRIDGDKCLQELQKLRQFDDPQIIIYSSSIPKDWEGRLSEMGVNDFIQKTESVPMLVSKIQDLIHSN
jgi:DNA-binding response OmpR family regulator